MPPKEGGWKNRDIIARDIIARGLTLLDVLTMLYVI